MPRIFRKRSNKTGLPPGTLVHVGEKKADKTRISLMNFTEGDYIEKDVESAEECFEFKDRPGVTWINIDGLHEVDIIEKIGTHFSLHPLTLEDILNTTQRPKMEDFKDYIFIVMKMFSLVDGNNVETAEQVSLVVGPGFVLSFQEKTGDVFDCIRERIRTGKGRVRKMGADYLAYALIDAIVDSYFLILEMAGDRIEHLEGNILKNPNPETLSLIHKLKRKMIYLRKSVWPLREVVSSLERSESSLIKKTTLLFLKDIYDHTIQVIDTVETFRDMLSGLHDTYLSSVSNRMNEVMKVLTVIATIFIPLTFIAGIYGMNFKFMPELEWHWGYFFVWGIIVVIAVFMVLYFKRKKWF